MKGVVFHQYGLPHVVIRIEDIDKPVPNDEEVLIRVRAASVNPLDEAVVKGNARIAGGLRRPKVTRLGFDVAGVVETTGRNVTEIAPGDEVFGVCVRDPDASAVGVWTSQGAFGEYACAPRSMVVRKPEHVTWAQAAAVPIAGFTALQGLRDKGRLRAGDKVLINGAAGGVGTVAVQVAKSLGADVTAVCSTRNVELVRSIGADAVIDYSREDVTRGAERYDLIFDCVGNHSLSACRRILRATGTHVLVGDRTGRGMLGTLTRVMGVILLSRVPGRHPTMFLARPRTADLSALQQLMAAGRLRPVIDKSYALNEVPQALHHLEGRHARGKIVISV